jgi:hypothetical protein
LTNTQYSKRLADGYIWLITKNSFVINTNINIVFNILNEGGVYMFTKCQAKGFRLLGQLDHERWKGVVEHNCLESSARLPDDSRECSLKANILINPNQNRIMGEILKI